MRWIAIMWLMLGGCLGGCTGKDASFEQKQQALAATMDVLRQARFKGQVRFSEAGSPFGFNAATNWSLGPQQMTFAVEGDCDFTQAPRPGEMVATFPSKTVTITPTPVTP